MKVIDISVPLHKGMHLWPGSRSFDVEQVMSLDQGDEANVSALACDVHMGTHIDAPLHFINEGKSIDQISLDTLCGQAFVADMGDVEKITAELLDNLGLQDGTRRLLLRTTNSALWKKNYFDPNYVALTEGAAEWVVNKGIGLVGIDYLSIQLYQGSPEVHRILLGGDVVVLEGINLALADAGQYELICLPLKMIGTEGAPARVILRTLEKGSCHGH